VLSCLRVSAPCSVFWSQSSLSSQVCELRFGISCKVEICELVMRVL